MFFVDLTGFNYIDYFQIQINTDTHGKFIFPLSSYFLYFLVDYLNVLRILYWGREMAWQVNSLTM